MEFHICNQKSVVPQVQAAIEWLLNKEACCVTLTAKDEGIRLGERIVEEIRRHPFSGWMDHATWTKRNGKRVVEVRWNADAVIAEGKPLPLGGQRVREEYLEGLHVKGTWVHVMNGGLGIDVAQAMRNFMRIQGEVCVSDIGDDLYITRRPWVAAVVSGTCSVVHTRDVYSDVDAFGQRYVGERVGNEDRREGWLVPAEAQLVAVVTEDGYVAKSLEEAGIPVFFRTPDEFNHRAGEWSSFMREDEIDTPWLERAQEWCEDWAA